MRSAGLGRGDSVSLGLVHEKFFLRQLAWNFLLGIGSIERDKLLRYSINAFLTITDNSFG
jgi:hypothetical protein